LLKSVIWTFGLLSAARKNIPELLLSKVHNVLSSDLSNSALNVFGAQSASGGDDLAADIFGNGSGSVKRQKDGSLQLSLGTLDLRLSDVEGQTRPFTEREVNEVIKAGLVLANQVDTPETEL
jgi:hypothetical protein